MTDTTIPVLTFNQGKAQDIPFEIFRVEGKSEYPVVPFRQTFYGIAVVTEGAGKNHIDFHAYPIETGTVYFISPGQVQRWEPARQVNGYVLLFEEGFFLMNGVDPITPRSFDFFHRTDLAPVLDLGEAEAEMIALCEDMLRGCHDRGFGRAALLQSYLQVFLIRAQRLFTRQHTFADASSGGSLVTNYIRLIDLHFMQKQRVREYAAMLGVTPGHLTDTTNEKLGMSAGHLIQRRVLLEARRLLTYSEENVGEIAFKLNFTDPSYFARYFRRETGQSPTTFRAEIREKYLSPRIES
ncbi:MAG: AraC family transcriptional regulator [Chloroflexota bacterium]